jgi:phage-related protein
MIDIEVLWEGDALVLYALVVNHKSLVREFIGGLEVDDKKQVAHLIKQRADRLIIHNEQIFRSIGNDIFDLKSRNGIRILCFWEGIGKVILTHGFSKPPQKVLKQEKKKAIGWLKEHREKKQ